MQIKGMARQVIVERSGKNTRKRRLTTFDIFEKKFLVDHGDGVHPSKLCKNRSSIKKIRHKNCFPLNKIIRKIVAEVKKTTVIKIELSMELLVYACTSWCMHCSCVIYKLTEVGMVCALLYLFRFIAVVVVGSAKKSRTHTSTRTSSRMTLATGETETETANVKWQCVQVNNCVWLCFILSFGLCVHAHTEWLRRERD